MFVRPVFDGTGLISNRFQVLLHLFLGGVIPRPVGVLVRVGLTTNALPAFDAEVVISVVLVFSSHVFYAEPTLHA